MPRIFRLNALKASHGLRLWLTNRERHWTYRGSTIRNINSYSGSVFNISCSQLVLVLPVMDAKQIGLLGNVSNGKIISCTNFPFFFLLVAYMRRNKYTMEKAPNVSNSQRGIRFCGVLTFGDGTNFLSLSPTPKVIKSQMPIFHCSFRV